MDSGFKEIGGRSCKKWEKKTDLMHERQNINISCITTEHVSASMRSRFNWNNRTKIGSELCKRSIGLELIFPIKNFQNIVDSMVFYLTLNSNNLSENLAKLLEKLLLTTMSGKEEQKANYYPDLIKLAIFWFVFHTLHHGGKAACVSRMYVRAGILGALLSRAIQLIIG